MTKCKTYVQENIIYGRDSKGNNKILYAFLPLKIVSVSAGATHVLVKPKGRGNYRKYLARTELLHFGTTGTF